MNPVAFLSAFLLKIASRFVHPIVAKQHFEKHREEFPDLTTTEEYTERAAKVMKSSSPDVIRWNEGDRVIHFNRLTGEKVIANKEGRIISFYRV